jgi:hypothetical protein
MLTSRIRQVRARGDSGAIAVIAALVTVVLFATAALAVDLGSMYARRRGAQTDADLAALAGAAKLPDQDLAFDEAFAYLEKNLSDLDEPIAEAAMRDGDTGNGEILFPSAYKIRVVVPPRTVEFGFAGAMGFSEADVSAAATVEVRSPAATLPFFVTLGGASGYSCLKDTSGGKAKSAMRDVLLAPAPKAPSITSRNPTTASTLGGTQITLTGANLDDVVSVKVDGVEVSGAWSAAANGKSLTFSAPAHAASAGVVVRVANGASPPDQATTTITYTAPPPAAAPTVTAVTPASGPEAGGTAVVITGTGFTGATGVMFGTTAAVNPTITNSTTIAATSPAGTGAVHVTVMGPGGTSATSNADLFTYEVDACGGVSGSYGYLDIPRSTPPTPNGANDLVMINSVLGIDHAWSSFPPSQMPALGTECKSGNTTIAGAILDNGNGVDGANCVDIQNGNKTSDVATAFLDGYTKSNPDLDPRLKAPSGHTSVTIHGRGGMDGDHISKYLASGVTLQMFTNALSSGTVHPEWLKPEIAQCPRFAIVPILNVNANPSNGFYPIKGFAGVFLDGAAPNYGLEPNNNGNQVQSLRAYAFSLDFLPGVISSGTTEGTVTYLGAGPKVPVLVHDAGDPSY